MIQQRTINNEMSCLIITSQMLAENSCLTAGQTNTAGSGPTAVVLQSVLHYPAHCSPSLHCRMHLQRNPPSEFVPLLCPGTARRGCKVLKWDTSTVLTSLCVKFWSVTGPQCSPLSLASSDIWQSGLAQVAHTALPSQLSLLVQTLKGPTGNWVTQQSAKFEI